LDWETPLHGVARYGNYAAAKLLIETGVSINAETYCKKSWEFDRLPEVWLVHTFPASTALHQATYRRTKAILWMLLYHGAVIDESTKDGRTAIQIALADDAESNVRILFEFGAHVDISKSNETIQKRYEKVVSHIRGRALKLDTILMGRGGASRDVQPSNKLFQPQTCHPASSFVPQNVVSSLELLTWTWSSAAHIRRRIYSLCTSCAVFAHESSNERAKHIDNFLRKLNRRTVERSAYLDACPLYAVVIDLAPRVVLEESNDLSPMQGLRVLAENECVPLGDVLQQIKGELGELSSQITIYADTRYRGGLVSDMLS
jgi:hypothetical protein